MQDARTRRLAALNHLLNSFSRRLEITVGLVGLLRIVFRAQCMSGKFNTVLMMFHEGSRAVCNRIDAREQKDFPQTRTSTRQEALILCSLPRQRHLQCVRSLHRTRSFLTLLSGIVLDCLGPQDVGEALY